MINKRQKETRKLFRITKIKTFFMNIMSKKIDDLVQKKIIIFTYVYSCIEEIKND